MTGWTRTLATVLAATMVVCACGDVGSSPGSHAASASGGTPASGASTLSAPDYCEALGFTEGEQRNDADQLIAECHPGPTPNGAAYSIARYLDAGSPTDKSSATTVEISEYDADGKLVHTSYGTLTER